MSDGIGEGPESDRELDRAVSALVTEHFVLQSMRGTLSSESVSRASIFLATVSSSLVALGFASRDDEVFAWLAAPLLVVLVALGEITFVRLVEVSLEDVVHLNDIFRIRRLYARLGPTAHGFFAEDEGADPWVPIAQTMGQGRRGQVWFTVASLIGVVNATLLATGAALLLRVGLDVDISIAAVVGVALGVVAVAGHVLWQQRQYRGVWPSERRDRDRPARAGRRRRRRRGRRQVTGAGGR